MLSCRRLLHLPPISAYSTSHRYHLLAAAAAVETQVPPPKTPPYVVQYLIDSCGFSPDMAAKASKYLAHIKSPAKPDSVIRFLKQSGLDDAHIRGAISRLPSLLLADVETTLKPKLEVLRELGFSESELPELILLCPYSLKLCDMKPKIDFWRAFYPTNETLFKVIRRQRYLLSTNLERIVPNMSLLRRCSLSDHQIAKMILRSPGLISRALDSIEALVQQAQDLGISPGSGMFYFALCAVNKISKPKIKAKIDLLESLGCSKAVIKSSAKTLPHILMISEKKISDNMDFLMKKAGCNPSYIIFRPALLHYSVEKRLVPRQHVLQILKSKGLAMGCGDFYSAMSKSDKLFLDKFVLPHKEMIPGLLEAYFAACAGKVTIQATH